MQILAIATVRNNVPIETLMPHLEAEERLSWQYYKDGTLRSFYGRDPATDAMGAIFIFECSSIAEAEALTAAYPLAKANLITFQFHILEPFTNFELLFKQEYREA